MGAKIAHMRGGYSVRANRARAYSLSPSRSRAAWRAAHSKLVQRRLGAVFGRRERLVAEHGHLRAKFET